MKSLIGGAALAMFFAAAPALAAPASAQSRDCSAQADAKGLHGADREKFRTSCIKGAAPAAPAKAVAVEKAPAKAVAMPAAAAAPAKPAIGTALSPASKACSDQADAKGLHGKDRETFRNQCLKGSAPVAAAGPAVAAAPSAAPSAAARPGAAKVTAAPGTRTPGQIAETSRIRDCGAQWKAAKAANQIPAGQTWPKYWSQCSARMKAAGK
jgi:hypothetical protein